MESFNVIVEKYCKGVIKVQANSEQEAKDKVMKDIRNKIIKPWIVVWEDQDRSFQTTGDIAFDFMGNLKRPYEQDGSSARIADAPERN